MCAPTLCFNYLKITVSKNQQLNSKFKKSHMAVLVWMQYVVLTYSCVRRYEHWLGV